MSDIFEKNLSIQPFFKGRTLESAHIDFQFMVGFFEPDDQFGVLDRFYAVNGIDIDDVLAVGAIELLRIQ